MLVSCLLTLVTYVWSCSASQPRIRLDAQEELLYPSRPADPVPAPSASNSISKTSIANAKANHNGTGVSRALFAELEELARIVDISYCVGTVGSSIQPPFACPSRCGDFPSFELIKTFNTGVTLSDSCGYIALSHAPAPKRIIIAFRGTYSIGDTIADLSTIPQAYVPYPGSGDDDDGDLPGDDDDDGSPGHEPDAPKCENCTVHTGFYTSWLNTREIVLPPVLQALDQYHDYAVTVVGHSLGGAVAAFAGLELVARGLNPTVTTFGEPRIGNTHMATYLDARFKLTDGHSNLTARPYRRVTHIGDPVPLLPLDEWGYVPHGGEIFISKWELPPEVEDVRHCDGAADASCVAQPEKGFFAIPARFKLWQLFFAHRDYFWRLGLCVPSLEGWWPGMGGGSEVVEVEL